MTNIHHIAQILTQAGTDILLPAFQQHAQSQTKSDGSIVTEADVACQAFLQNALSQLAPHIGFLGEEMSEEEQCACLNSDTSFWCVDPLDGTSNFATPMPLFAISVALMQHGHPILACIHDPIRQETYTAQQGQGAYLNGQRLTHPSNIQLQEAVGFLDFKRFEPALAQLFSTQRIYRSQRNIGTCALEWAWLAAGRAQFLIHGAEKLWDYAAGSLLAAEAGHQISDFSGHPLFQNKVLSSSILAAPTSIHHQLKKHIQNNSNTTS